MQPLGTLAAIWRYPIKSLAAQPLESTRLEANGIPGDRSAALFANGDHFRAGKTYEGIHDDRLHLWDDPDDARKDAGARGVALELRSDLPRYHFSAPISLIFDRWIAQVEEALGTSLDPRRWRPNLLAKSAPNFTDLETDLLGAFIDIGDARLRVVKPIKRCVVTTYDVQGGKSDPRVLSYVAQQRDNIMGVYCEVELAGEVRAGDPLRLRERCTSRTTASSASM